MAGAPCLPAEAQWPQWGGPQRSFKTESGELAESWPKDGPRRIWSRRLGDGYSAIVADGGMLFTMYRLGPEDEREITVALDAATGRTLWQHVNPAPLTGPPDDSGWGGKGPNSTPLVAHSRLITIGSRALLHCFDRQTGKVLWRVDLAADLGAPVEDNVGYSPSPIAYAGTVVVPVGVSRGGKGQTLAAFSLADGALVWKGLSFPLDYSSPIMIRYRDRDQLVMTTRQGLIGVDPADGSLIWRHSKAGSIVTPVSDGADLLFYSTGGSDAVGRVVRLTSREEKVQPVELWSGNKVLIWQPTPVVVDGFLYGSTTKKMLCVDLTSGELRWSRQGFPMASCVWADGKLIILDKNGKLSLATAAPEGMEVHARCKVTEKYSFTVPTLVGTTLYLRDRKNAMALDLGNP
jgi:outer membrane protein assembly factor BamB